MDAKLQEVTIALIIAAAVVLATAIAAQVALPRIAAGRIRDRLTEFGGSAEVRVAALPATRLLGNRGDRLEVRGRGLEIGLAAGGGGDEDTRTGLAALDGFDDVDVELVDFRTGPFAIAGFVLARSGSESYAMATRGTVTGTELVRLSQRLLDVQSLPGAPLLGAVAGTIPTGNLGGFGGLGGLSGWAGREIPIALEIELISERGRLRVGTGGGSIAGYPAGPVASAIAAAVARRLEIAP